MPKRNEQEIFSELQKLDAAEYPLSEVQRQRILAYALEKTGLERKVQMEGKKKSKRFKRALRITLIAAAMLSVSAASVYAVGPQLLTMLSEKIDFFSAAPSQAEVSDPVEAPRGEYTDVKTKLEAYNAPVGQSVTDNGVTVTLDTISMDVSSMDIFLTITGEDAIQEILDSSDYGPTWSQFFGTVPNFLRPVINGKTIAQNDVDDWYLAEDGSLKYWKHYILTEMPKGDEITVELTEDNCALGRKGTWNFTVTLDGASVRAGARIIEPDIYEMPDRVYPNFDGLGNSLTVGNNLELDYLAFGPVGGVIKTKIETKHGIGVDGAAYEAGEGMAPGNLYIVDNTGKEIYTSKSAVYGGDALNLSRPDENAVSLTMTPVYAKLGEDGEWLGESRIVTLDELKKGTKIETTPYGGYTVRNFTIKNSAVTYDLVPYGYPGYDHELYPQYDGKITEIKEQVTDLSGGETAMVLKSGLISSTVDPQTGIISTRHDFYAATDEEIETVTEWRYIYTEMEMDTEHTVTVDLKDFG